MRGRAPGFVAVIVVLVASAIVASACRSSNSPTMMASPPLNLTGTWSGDLGLQGMTTRMTWTVTQNDNTVAGSVLISMPSGTVLLNGALAGTLSGSTLTYTIGVSPGGIPSQPACTGQLGGSVTAAMGLTSTLTGSYRVISTTCPSPLSTGNFTLTKQ